MIIRSCVAVVSICFLSDFGVLAMRGPHHPRNQQIVKSHAHYKPLPPSGGEEHVKLTQDSQLIQDEDHIREDMSGQVSSEMLKNMTPEEMEFYYFKLHDFNNDSRLDGLELLKAIDHAVNAESHYSHESHDESHDEPARKKLERSSDEDFFYFTQLVDEVLLADDTNNDGYLSYAEYTIGKRKGVSKMGKKQAQTKTNLINGQSTS